MAEVIEYPKIRSPKYVAALLEGRSCIVQPKLDGSNVAVRRTREGEIVFQSRTQVLDPIADARGIFKNFLDWGREANARGGFDLLPIGAVLYGETLNQNGKIKYTDAQPFVLFDVLYEGGSYPEAWDPEPAIAAEQLGLPYVGTLGTGRWGTDFDANTDFFDEFLVGSNAPFGGARNGVPFCEGVVVKTYATEIDGWGIGHHREAMVAAKIVAPEYAEAKVPKKAVDKVDDPLDVIAESFMTEARFDKARQKAIEQGKDPDRSPHHMIGIASKDVHDEEEQAIKDMLFRAYWKPIAGRIAQRVLAIHGDRAAGGLA